MLNPTATEFQPSGSFQPQPSKSNPKLNVNVNSTPQQKTKAKKQSVDNGKNVGTDKRHSKPSQNKPETKRQGSAPDAAHGRKGASSKQNETKARVDGGKSRTTTNRATTNGKKKAIDPRVSLVASSVKTKSNSKVQNMEPASSITIMEAIEPVNLVTGEGSALSIANGCELYVQWIGRCLQQHEEVTLIGIDQAISDAITIVSILQDSDIARYHEVESFSLEESRGVIKPCLLFRLHVLK